MNISLDILAKNTLDLHPVIRTSRHTRSLCYLQLGAMPSPAREDTIYVYETDFSAICAETPSGTLTYASSRLTDIFNRLARALYFYENIERRLRKTLFLSDPWQEITDIVGEIFDQPVMLLDQRGNLRGMTKKYEKIPITSEWLNIARQKHITQETSDLFLLDILKPEPSVVYPPAPFVPYLQFGFFRKAPFMYSLYLAAWNRAFDEVDIQLAEAIQDIVDDLYTFNLLSLTPIEEMLVDILDGQPLREESFYWLDTQWRQSEKFPCLLAIFSDATPAFPYQHAQTSVLLKKEYPNSIIFSYQDTLLALLLHEENSSLKKLEQTLQKHSYCCGVSLPFDDLHMLPAFYQQALACVESGRQNQQTLVFAQTAMPHLILTECRHICQRNHLLHPAILKLQDYDQANQTDLLKTAYLYLVHRQSNKKAADALFIHRNTLLYRLKQIQEISDLDFENYLDCLTFLLSYECLT